MDCSYIFFRRAHFALCVFDVDKISQHRNQNGYLPTASIYTLAEILKNYSAAWYFI